MRTACRALALLAIVLVPGVVSAAAPTPACQRAVARGGAKFVKVVLKITQRCAVRNGAAACRPAVGRDTGNAAIARATRRLAADLSGGCARSDLSAFARRCADPTGAPLSLAELLACVRDSHLARVGALLEVEFPGPSAQPAQTGGTCGTGQTCECSCSASGAFLDSTNSDVL